MHGVVHTKLCKLQQRLNILVMTFGVDGATSSTLCAFVEVRKEVSKADSRDVYDNVKRALEKNENPMPERFIVSHREGYDYSLHMPLSLYNPGKLLLNLQFVDEHPKTFSGKIVRHILRRTATKSEKLMPGEEIPEEAPYEDDLNQISEDNYRVTIIACYS